MADRVDGGGIVVMEVHEKEPGWGSIVGLINGDLGGGEMLMGRRGRGSVVKGGKG